MYIFVQKYSKFVQNKIVKTGRTCDNSYRPSQTRTGIAVMNFIKIVKKKHP